MTAYLGNISEVTSDDRLNDTTSECRRREKDPLEASPYIHLPCRLLGYSVHFEM